jgi:hypothetical protein
MNPAALVGIGSVLITFSIFLSTVIFRMGHLSARVEELEKWRANMRNDMHEISDQMAEIVRQMGELHTLITERTERRALPRECPL